MTPLTATALRGAWATALLSIRPDESIDSGVLAAAPELFAAPPVTTPHTQ
ncbi:MAG TPA: hypothetical protein VD903_12885 [Pseudonocardia sp.]|nr:hypothetical protein [Pseudonocardia sp.]